jgi:glucose-6-phosphate 1-dehydrogenase
VQITLSEKEGVGTRGNFYDGVGALRDVTQNHLTQLIAMIAMESPRSFSSEGVREARAKAIEAIRCIKEDAVSDTVIRGQYEGYKGEKNVNQQSSTETFVALKLFVDSPRFKGVPFYVRSGKGLEKDVVEISLVFKQVCHLLFKEVGCPEEGNVLTMRIQPDEGINIRFIAKEPGHAMKLSTINMDFSYAEEFKSKEVVDAYERVLEDAFTGDQMLFNRTDELTSSWRFITDILNAWQSGKSKLYLYPKGSWGPNKANELIEKDGRKWVVSK